MLEDTDESDATSISDTSDEEDILNNADQLINVSVVTSIAASDEQLLPNKEPRPLTCRLNCCLITVICLKQMLRRRKVLLRTSLIIILNTRIINHLAYFVVFLVNPGRPKIRKIISGYTLSQISNIILKY